MHPPSYSAVRQRPTRGAAYLGALAIVFVFSMIGSASLMLVTQQLKLTKTERDYERSLQAAEAGLNAAMNRITHGAAAGSPNEGLVPVADIVDPGAIPTTQQFHDGVLDGTYTVTRYPAGSEQGYWAATVGKPQDKVKIVSFGWCNGVVRRVMGAATVTDLDDPTVPDTEVPPKGDYAVFGVSSVDAQNNTVIRGNVGTGGALTFGSNTTVAGGKVFLCGTSTPPSGIDTSKVAIVTKSAADWPTVDQLTAPLGGWAGLAATNDNDLATINNVKGIPGNAIDVQNNAAVFLPGKAGGANYYLTNFSAKNNCVLTIGNSDGPVSIWLGPSDGSGGWDAGNNLTIVLTSADKEKKCRVYVGTAGTVSWQNNAGSAIGVYAYNVLNKVPIGTVEIKNNAGFGGSVIANDVVMKNNTLIDYTNGQFFRPRGKAYYRSDGWRE